MVMKGALHARSAIGVQALPMDLPVIIDALVEIEVDDNPYEMKIKNIQISY